MPPELFDVVDACPEIRTWRTLGRADEVDLAGVRDRALLLVGFVGGCGGASWPRSPPATCPLTTTA
jgi:hypothetical protein